MVSPIDRINSASTLEEVRLALASIADVDREYDWARSAIQESTTGFVAGYLKDNPPERWHRCNQISEHVRVAGNHLEQCVQRQDQLFDLEASCLSAVIDFLNAEEVFDIDRELETAGALAASRTADLPVDGVVERVRTKHEVRRKAFDYRIKLFRTKGGALNFNERIGALRLLQAESMRIIEERLHALRAGLAIAGIAKLKNPPSWTVDASGPLMERVLWLRSAMRAMEMEAVKEYPVTVYLRPCGMDYRWFEGPNGIKFRDGAELRRYLLANRDWKQLYFKFDSGVIKSYSGYEWVTDSARVIAFSMGFVCGNDLGPSDRALVNDEQASYLSVRHTFAERWVSRQHGSVRVLPPNQQVKLDDDGLKFELPQRWIYLDGQVPITRSCDERSLCSLPSGEIANLNPYGRWRLDVLPMHESPWDWRTRFEASNALSSDRDFHDLLLSITLAVKT
jgi:hypothetical protein